MVECRWRALTSANVFMLLSPHLDNLAQISVALIDLAWKFSPMRFMALLERRMYAALAALDDAGRSRLQTP